jgi:putative ABC transport system substrate-binding protein
MDKRTFLLAAAAGGLAVLAQRDACAQATTKPRPTVGFLTSFGADSLAQLREAMRELGYAEGRDFVIELRSAEGVAEALPRLASELVAQHVDVLYATGPAAVRAAKDSTGTIPIVAFDLETDPVASGLVRSLARPGGNLTGLFLDLPTLAGKWLELIAAVVPGARHVAVLWDETTGTAQVDAARAAARTLSIEERILRYRSGDDVESALAAGLAAQPRAVMILSSPIASSRSRALAQILGRRRMPGISPFRAFAEDGGLMSYGPNLREFRRYSADYVDRIVKGASPAELPIQQPTKFALVLNLKAAQALRLTVPKPVLLAADEVIS